MKKGIVIGGSNGIGLAIVNRLLDMNYFVYIFDKNSPSSSNFVNKNYEFVKCNLLDFDEVLFRSYTSNDEIDCLFLTAGYGYLCDFSKIHISEIQNMMQVNAVSLMKIVNIFYHRINSSLDFYCGIISSIAGIVSSPLFSVYSASKGALHRFIESVNIELEVNKSSNRITNISPGSISGTRFNGGSNDLNLTKNLAQEIVESVFNRETILIPKYKEVYEGVIENYLNDPHQFGLNSYNYKIGSGRVSNETHVCIGYLSGTFDLFHNGHLNLLKKAKEACDYLIVGVHKDASHKGKKVFIPFEERKLIVAGCRYVDKVVESCEEDSDAWYLYHYDKLFVGSDYKGSARFLRYEHFFEDKNVQIIYFDYTQGTSSTIIRKKIIDESFE